LVKEKIQSIKADTKEGKQKIYRDLIEALVYSYNLGSDEQQKDEKYTINDVIDEFCTLFAAGTDTTTHFFMMMIYYIV
jgi:cytochrome P450